MKEQYIITLDDNNKYLVISRAEYQGSKYCYLGRLDNSNIFEFAEIKNNEIEFIKDLDLIKEISPLLLENIPNS